jgi:hypothetical protein
VNPDLIRQLVHPDDVPAWEASLAMSRKGGNSDVNFRIRTSSGEIKHLHSVSRVTKRDDAGPVLVGAIQDVTARKVADAAFNRARPELAHVSRIATLGTLGDFRNAVAVGALAMAAPVLGKLILGPSDVAAYFAAQLALVEVEECWLVGLDNRHRVVGQTILSRGSATRKRSGAIENTV